MSAPLFGLYTTWIPALTPLVNGASVKIENTLVPKLHLTVPNVATFEGSFWYLDCTT